VSAQVPLAYNLPYSEETGEVMREVASTLYSLDEKRVEARVSEGDVKTAIDFFMSGIESQDTILDYTENPRNYVPIGAAGE
jgi:hypothetical protein